MRRLSGDSFFQSAEIYGDPHAGMEFGMDSVLPAGGHEELRLFGWAADAISRGDMSGLDRIFRDNYDKFAEVNRVNGDLVVFPWMRQMIDPFGCDKAKNTSKGRYSRWRLSRCHGEVQAGSALGR